MASMQDAVDHLQATLPRDQVLDGARLINDFVEKFKSHVAGVMGEQDASQRSEFVVTKDVVDDFLLSLRASQPQQQ